MLKAFQFSHVQLFGCGGRGAFPESRKGSSVVLVGQGIGHTSHHLLIGSLRFRGEFLAEVAGQHTHQHIAQELWGRDKRHVFG